MNYSLNSLKGGRIWGIIQGTTIGVIKGNTRSLDNGSCRDTEVFEFSMLRDV